MKYVALLLSVLASAPGSRGHAAEFGNFIHASGRADIEVLSDQATLLCGVTVVRKKPDSAVARSGKVAQSILRIAAAYGVDKSDIATAISELEKEYRNSADTTTYLGVKSSTIFEIKVRKIDSLSRFINEMYAAGMNDIRSIEYRYSKEDSLKRVAGDLAMSDALGNARAMVRHQGREIGKLLGASYEIPRDFHMRAGVHVDDLLGAFWAGGSGGIPEDKPILLEYLKILPKKINVTSEVFAKYELK